MGTGACDGAGGGGNDTGRDGGGRGTARNLMTLSPSTPSHPVTLEKGKLEDPRTCSSHIPGNSFSICLFVLNGPGRIAWCSSVLRLDDLCPGSVP